MTEDLRKIDRIIIRYLLNEAPATEKEYLLNWLREDVSHRQHFFAFKDLWEISQKNLPEIAKTEKSLANIKKEIETTAPAPAVRTRSLFLRLLRYAALILVLAGAGTVIYKISDRLQKKQSVVTYNEIITSNGQKKEVTLPDGTRVWLNSGTTFRYSGNYGKTDREVFLRGEAFFDVKRDESRTFIVRADNITIKVLGTSFNVNCYPELDMVETTVISGTVSVENNTATEGGRVILNKLEKGTYLKENHRILKEMKNTLPDESAKPIGIKKLALGADETTDIASWKDQTLSFNNETLEDMAVKLQRWFDVSIIIQDENLRNYRYKGKFNNVKSIFQVLEVVKLATPITYEYNEKTREITIKELKH